MSVSIKNKPWAKPMIVDDGGAMLKCQYDQHVKTAGHPVNWIPKHHRPQRDVMRRIGINTSEGYDGVTQ